MMTRLFGIAIAALSLPAAHQAAAQSGSDLLTAQFKQMCNEMYEGVVLGTRDLSGLASSDVVNRISVETGGSGYADLPEEIGKVQSLGVSDIVHLSYGDVFVCKFGHETGDSVWTLAYSPMFQTISDFQLKVEKDEPEPAAEAPVPVPVPATRVPVQPEEPAPTPAGNTSGNLPDNVPPAPTQSEACQMFPDLC